MKTAARAKTGIPHREERRTFLLGLITRRGGRWDPSHVAKAYATHGYDAPKGTTHAADLDALYRRGHLDRHDTPRGRYFTLNTPPEMR